jgi:hypothetical protein
MGRTFQEMGWANRLTNVRRKELLDILHANRETHIADYKTACQGYKQIALDKIDETFKHLRKQVSEIKEGVMIQVCANLYLPLPVSYEKAYNQAIRMMELETEEVLQLTASQFACFVMDDWDWTNEWRTSTTPYFGGIKASWDK